MRMPGALIVVAVVMGASIVSGCSGDDASSVDAPQADPREAAARHESGERVAQIGSAVSSWGSASSVDEAQAFAARARNLVVGPQGPGFAASGSDDAGIDTIKVGLLPGLDGSEGLASPLSGSCAERDVLGGGWSDPVARWDAVSSRVADWSEADNRFPELDSHPQRVVGWASLALASTDISEIREFAAHAALHVDVSNTALEC